MDNDDGVILDRNVEIGAPADAPQLAPAIERIRSRTGRTPRAVTDDRDYGYANVDENLHQAGVREVAIPGRSPLTFPTNEGPRAVDSFDTANRTRPQDLVREVYDRLFRAAGLL